MKCDFCGRDEALPFVCNYCGGAFCPDHRLPEAHQCKGDLSQKRTIIAPTQTTFSWQTPSTTTPYQPRRQGGVFSQIEVRDIVIAWLAIGFAVGTSLSGGLLFGSLNPLSIAVLMGVALITVGPGFIFHELSHKFVARRYGFWAEFRMWPQMLLVAIVMAVLISVFFAAPGATYISGNGISKKENGVISLAGPLVNGLIALLFLPLFLFTTGDVQFVGAFGLYVNVVLGVFNLIPFGPLDGAKVLSWNKVIWGVIFAVFAVAAYVAYSQVVPVIFA